MRSEPSFPLSVWLVMMFAPYFRQNARRWMLASIACLLCCAMVVGAIGFPTVRRVAKDRSSPFPCQDKVCGCADAASCWKSCCCHTNQQKIAWAKKHGVTPPAFVVAAAAKESTTKVATCCQKAGSAKKPTCALATKPKDVAPAESSGDQATELALVLGNSQRKCQGLAPLWTLLGQAIVPPLPRPVATAPAAGEWIKLRSESVCGVMAPPRLRPPRA